MQRTPIPSLFLLAVFALGGGVAPSLHQVWHAEEWATEQAAHVADGHHHHAATHTHGAEFDVPCPPPAVLDLHCVLCHGVSAQLAAGSAAILVPPPTVQPFTEHTGRAASAVGVGYSSRGPPLA